MTTLEPTPPVTPQTGPGAKSPATSSERLNPSRAASDVARWRRALADAAGGDPGGALDEPRNRLTLLKIFGSTCRLADLCLKAPQAAATALIEGPSSVIAEAARDLSNLQGGVGGPDALHGALEPIKARVDLAVGIAELSGAWTAAEASVARAEFAERLVDTALVWLLRGGINRGELSIDLNEGAPKGVFALAGGDFAHEDLAPFGPLDVAIFYDSELFTGSAASMAERAFVRLGTEFREVFEGKTGEYALFSLRAPLGSGLQGAGLVENLARAKAACENEQERKFRAFLASARIVGGDRAAGGAFLEQAEEIIWGSDKSVEDLIAGSESADPRSAFRRLADVLRLGLGRTRPVFRTISAHSVFKKAAEAGIVPTALSARLVAGEEFTQSYVSRLQLIKGAASVTVSGADEESALASLCGYSSFHNLKTVLTGVIADAENAYPVLVEGPRAEFNRYKPAGDDPDDIDKLRDLGFSNGEYLSRVVDGWAGLAACTDEKRFSAVAPGLLTAFGETQHPDRAIALFDSIMNAGDAGKKVLPVTGEEGAARNALVDAIGCVNAAVEPLTKAPGGVAALLERGGAEVPETGAEWVARYAPPSGDDADEIAIWRRENIASIAKCAASGEITFGVASSAMSAIHDATLSRLFAQHAVDSRNLALHVFDGPSRGLPGAKTLLGVLQTGEKNDAAEDVARGFIDALHSFDSGYLAFAPDIIHRPGGVAGALAPDEEAFKSYIQSEAVAFDQILLSRARVIAGSDAAQERATSVLRVAVSNPKRADILFRDLDRARAQTMRRDRAASEWDLERIDGGLSDVELIISTLIYRHAAAQPSIQTGNIEDALDTLARAGLIPADVAATLTAARAFWRRLATAKALASWNDPQQQPVRPRFAALLARAAEVDRYAQVKPLMRGYAEEVNRLYAQLVLGRPASSLVANA